MPAQRPRASFEPIPPDCDVRTLVEETENFQFVDRISCHMIAQQGVEQFEKLVLLHVIIGGKPLVIDGFDDLLDPWTFTPRWLRDNHGDKIEQARNLTAKENLPLTIGHYLKNMGRLADQFFEKPDNYKDKTRQRIYLKDIDCPPVWHDKLKEHIPAGLFYLNETTGEVGGPGAVEEDGPSSTGRRKGRGIARAGDLMSSLPPEMRAENLMCYIGHEGTYTPAHREMCASLGQNIMVDASTTVGEDGKPERPGSSIWFMTETKDRHTVAEYWLSVLGHDIEIEDHFAQIVAWKRAPFKTYIVEQKPGDFILIPPLAPHQVWNRGTRTMKVAWNRTTVETLEMALNEALPKARMVCRDEQYKNKAIVYYTLLKYSGLLRAVKAQSEVAGEAADLLRSSFKVRQVQRDFKRLLELYKSILLSEMFAPDGPREHPEFLPFDSNVTCAYCRGNIFNRFLTCKSCTTALGTNTEEPYDVCMDCYAMGRSCGCISGLKWVEQWKWKDLLHKYEEWRLQVIEIDGGVTEKTPVPLIEERRYLGKKTLAQVCQEQLRLRPWVDITQPPPPDDETEEEEILVDEHGNVKKTKKKRSKAWLDSHKRCHVCFHYHPSWKMAACKYCDLWYCYGSLYRGYEIMPQAVMEDNNWKCPHCQKICNRAACRRDPRQKPYEPKGTLLGHDTKKVADVRSVESLVDFSVSNLNWIRGSRDPTLDNARLQRRREEADRAKEHDPTLDERYYDEDVAAGAPEEEEMEFSFIEDNLPRTNLQYIDPSLIGGHYETSELQNGTSTPGGAFYDDRAMSTQGTPYYPDPEAAGGKRKRPYGDADEHIKLTEKKKRKGEKGQDGQSAGQTKNGATRQFKEKQEKQLLDDAKKRGRFIQVYAAMKGRKKLVTLKLPSERLRILQEREAAEGSPAEAHRGNGAGVVNGVILQSDVAPPPSNGSADTANPKPKAHPSRVRYRVEDDGDFGSRRRGSLKSGATATGSKSKSRTQYEEILVDSNEDVSDAETGDVPEPARKGRRISSWLARKTGDDDDEGLVELPSDFRDSRVGRRERRASGAKAAAGAQIRPTPSTSQRARASAAGKPADTPEGAYDTPSAAETEHTQAAAQMSEENRRAKLLAVEWVTGEEEEEEDVDDSDARSVDMFIDSLAAAGPVSNGNGNANHAASPATHASILSRVGRGGKKIKIVARKPAGDAPAASNGFTAVNNGRGPAPLAGSRSVEQGAVVQLTDSGSEDGGEEEEEGTPAARRASAGGSRRRGRPPKRR